MQDAIQVEPKLGLPVRVKEIEGVVFPGEWCEGIITFIEHDFVRFLPDEPDPSRNEFDENAREYSGDHLGWFIDVETLYASTKHIKGVAYDNAAQRCG